MERYWDAVQISATQKGLKQAVLQAQQEQPPLHHQHDDDSHSLVLGTISQQWSRTCQERARWYATMVTEQVYGKGVEDKRQEASMKVQQQQQQRMMVDDEAYDVSYHHGGAVEQYYYNM
jgi:hypothetical protein